MCQQTKASQRHPHLKPLSPRPLKTRIKSSIVTKWIRLTLSNVTVNRWPKSHQPDQTKSIKWNMTTELYQPPSAIKKKSIMTTISLLKKRRRTRADQQRQIKQKSKCTLWLSKLEDS